jgi:hypothetical protein
LGSAMRKRIGRGSFTGKAGVAGSIAGLLLLLLASVLVAMAAIASSPPAGEWFFQSPVSPIAPGGDSSPAVPLQTVTGPALVSMPAPTNFLPWIVGILVIGGIVGVVLFWRRDKEDGGEDA